MKKINYIDYGVGNFLSIKNSLKQIGYVLNVVDNPSKFDFNLHTILPGVGNFDYCIEKLKKNNFFEFFKNNKNFEKNVIGICVGMQLFFEKSEESKNQIGLGIFEGEVVNLGNLGDFITPVIGWKKIIGNKENNIFNKKYYFIHSYGNISCSNTISYYQLNGVNISAIVKKKNFIGLQFHPEKSGPDGLKLLDEYLK